MYQLGQITFGENYVQELVEKQAQLPATIQWHFIGHLQTNKVKYIAPFVHTIHAVDSLKLVLEVEKEAKKNNRKINCLLQLHIAEEETKFGLSPKELEQMVQQIIQLNLQHVVITGIMGMASNTSNQQQIENEFEIIKSNFDSLKQKYFSVNNSFQHISMGMSSDYELAVKHGSTMVRIGSLLFGERS